MKHHHTMATLSLKVSVAGSKAIKTMQFDPSMIVFDACRIIREKIQEANDGNRKLRSFVIAVMAAALVNVNLSTTSIFLLPSSNT